MDWLRKVLFLSRPVQSEEDELYGRRFDLLPESVKTRSQLLGRSTMGCEGTHKVFPKCSFSCKPCYHSKDANMVAVDGDHTLSEVKKQLDFSKTVRGVGVHCQLIGGEVSLLDASVHGQVLAAMLDRGRIPMSFSHGDFDYDYLKGVAQSLNRVGIRHISFAAHFDKMMNGRRGNKRPESEESLNPFRQRFCDMFVRLKEKDKLVDSFFLAHNMTVTPANVGEIPEVIRALKKMRFSLMSHQPAAFIGDVTRWNDEFRTIDSDYVWSKIEEGFGRPLPFRMLQMGDERCNRSVWGILVGDGYFPYLEEGDDEFRDAYFTVARIQFTNPAVGKFIPFLRLVRIILQRPLQRLVLLLRYLYLLIFVRIGLWNLMINIRQTRPITIVMHNFMDAENVKQAHALNQRNEESRFDLFYIYIFSVS